MRDLTTLAKLGFVLGAIVLTGCADLRSLHFHSETREAQGVAAQEKYDQADATVVLKAERERIDAILAQQLAQAPALSSVQRDWALLGVAFGGSLQSSLVGPVNTKLDRLVGTDATFYPQLMAIRSSQVPLKASLASATLVIDALGGELSCEAAAAGANKGLAEWVDALERRNPAQGTKARQAVLSAQSTCARLKQTEAQLTAHLNSGSPTADLVIDIRAVRDAEANLKAEKGKGESSRNQYRVGWLDFQSIVKPLPPAPAPAASAPTEAAAAAAPASAASAPTAETTQTKLTEALDRLKAAVKKLADAGDKYSLKFLSEARIETINELITALASPKEFSDPTATDKDRAARFLNDLFIIEANWEASNAEALEVLKRPALAQQELDALQAETLGRSIAADETRLVLLKRRVEIRDEQADALTEARDGLGKALPSKDKQRLKPVVALALSKPHLDGEAGSDVMGAVARYAYAMGPLDQGLVEVQRKLETIDRVQSLATSENHVRQWDTLIRSNLDLLSKWSATGVKEDTISKAVNALLLLWIAVKVD